MWADLGEMVVGWAGSAEWVGGGRGGTDLSEGFGLGGREGSVPTRWWLAVGKVTPEGGI